MSEAVENTEIVEQESVIAEQDDIQLESDIADEEAAKPTYEDLQKELEELKKKNENAEDVAKRLKDEKSQQNREKAELSKKEQAELTKKEFMTETLESALENGLTEDNFAKAEELGMSKAELELALYKSRESINSIYESAGGKDAYFNMVDTVKESVSEAEIGMFKNALSNPETAQLAILALKQKYSELYGSNSEQTMSRRVVPENPRQGTSQGYKDMSEYQADMRKMRTLPTMKQNSYYAKIQEKLNRSNLV